MKSFFRYIVSGMHYADSLFSSDASLHALHYPISIICKAYSMPKTAITILAFISNPTTKKEDIAALCEQIHVVYDGNRKVSTIVADAVLAIYESCAKEEMAKEIYNKVEAIAAMHRIPLVEPLFVDMLTCQKDPAETQKTRDDCRNPAIEISAS